MIRRGRSVALKLLVATPTNTLDSMHGGLDRHRRLLLSLVSFPEEPVHISLGVNKEAQPHDARMSQDKECWPMSCFSLSSMPHIKVATTVSARSSGLPAICISDAAIF